MYSTGMSWLVPERLPFVPPFCCCLTACRERRWVVGDELNSQALPILNSRLSREVYTAVCLESEFSIFTAWYLKLHRGDRLQNCSLIPGLPG